MEKEYIFTLHHNHLPLSVGNKARNLRSLVDHGYQIPETYVCTWEAYSQFMQRESTLMDKLKAEISRKLDLEKSFAVRSSANIEDDVNHSFAGQFQTFLDVEGIDGIMDAIQNIWENAQSPELMTYFEMSQIEHPEILMGIVIQEMVNPLVSGVSFSRNPLTGLDEIIVEAIQGNGTAIVQDGATPDRWVYKWGEWTAEPENAVIDQNLIGEVVDRTQSIENFYGKPVDLEWVYDGNDINWLQLREISSIEGINIYSNKIAMELLPGMIMPLIWSINIPLVNGAWVDLITKLIGPNQIDPLSLAKTFYFRAYFNMGVIGDILELLGFPRETLELMLGIEEPGPDKPKFKPSIKTYRHLPRMFVFIIDMLRKPRQIEKFIVMRKEEYEGFYVKKLEKMNAKHLLAQIEELYTLNQETAYYNIIIPLTMQFYNALLKRELEKFGNDYALLDLTYAMEALKEVDPKQNLELLAEQFCQLEPEQKRVIVAGSYEEFISLPGCEPFQQSVDQFITKFGHLSDSGNDFSYSPWRENPGLILKMIATNAEIEHKSNNKIRFEDVDTPGFSGLVSKSIYQRARRYFLYREQIGSLYTFGYGLFREYFFAMGERFRRLGLIENQDDIFYLTMEEVRMIVNAPQNANPFIAEVKDRKQEMEMYRNINPPSTIYGDQPVPLEEISGTTIHGTPTSRGYYQGPVKVVRGIGDSDSIERGDVLVVPYSDVGWTPMYVKAGAVVAESGGMLSHSSIVAREYGIPAVVSVPGACKLLSGKVVTVDGYRGKVTIHDA